MTRLIFALVALSLAFSLIALSPALAQRQSVPGFDVPVCEGQISTFPLDAIPDGETFWVDIFDETTESLEFRDAFLKTLRANGHQTNIDGRLVFSFESESAFLGLVPRGGVDRNQGTARSSRESDTNIGVRELRDTIREGGSSRRGKSSLGAKLDAKAELRDQDTGRVIWLATLSCTPLTGDRSVLIEFVSKVVVDSLERDGGQSSF
ncbi:MAG: hypothetical protein QMB76_00565 [Alphaproteobacteria bacterium]